jgi:diguanylate cyclase
MRSTMLLMTQFTLPTGLATPLRRFVERCHRLRMLGLGLGVICVGSVLYHNGAHPAVWVLLLANACAWPQLARALALRNRDAGTAEIRNRLIDSAMGGVWVALMQFNLLPSALLTAVLAIDKTNLGGWSLLGRGLLVQAAACVLTLTVHGFVFAPQTTMPEIVASLPLLVAYPLAVGMSMHALARRLREQNRRLIRLDRGDAANDARVHIG